MSGGNDTGLPQVGFTIDATHTDDVAWVGRLPKMRFTVLYYGDRDVARLAVMFLVGRHGRRRTRQGPGIARAKPASRG